MKKSALVVVENNTPITTSRIVAEQFDKRHDLVVRDIRTIIKQMASTSQSSKMRNGVNTPMFVETSYQAEEGGRTYPMYTMTRDGFSLLAMGFTGKKALEFKLKFINEFNRMEETLKKLGDKQILAWQKTRQLGKQTRKLLTRAIQTLEAYFAEREKTFPQGYLYGHLTNVIQNALGIDKGSRDEQSIRKLNQLDQAEDIAGNVILTNIASKKIETLAEIDAQILLQLRKLNELLCGQLFLRDGGDCNA